jgi:hypothetical protein
VRAPRAARAQEASRGRIAHHLPDGPRQRARECRVAGEDPLAPNDWLCAYDAKHAAITEGGDATFRSDDSHLLSEPA